MTFSFKGTPKLVETDIHEIIDSALMFLKSKLTDEIEVSKEYYLESKIDIYPKKMHQVIMNIIDNAIFSLNQSNKVKKEISIATKAEGEYAVLTISNTGLPIDEAHLSQLFDPFFTTKDPGVGTGLGLSICYTLITEHNGEIYAENINDGVRFNIKIPLKADPT